MPSTNDSSALPEPASPARRLETDCTNDYVNNVGIYFVDDANASKGNPAIRVNVARATSGTISNTPYAPDEDYSYEAMLYGDGDVLKVDINQYLRIIEDTSQTASHYFSLNGGRDWQAGEAPDQPIAGKETRLQLICRISTL